MPVRAELDDCSQAVDQYLVSLPHGIDSYPQCQTKASGFVAALRDKPFSDAPLHLPEPVEHLIRTPPLKSAWVPTVHFHCAMAAIRHHHFPGPGGEAQFLRFMKEKDRELFRTPMYRVMFFLVTPKRLLVGLAHRWHQFNRGSDLALMEVGERRAVLRLTHPPQLLQAENDRGWASAIEVAVEASGGRIPVIVSQRTSSCEVLYRVSWQ